MRTDRFPSGKTKSRNASLTFIKKYVIILKKHIFFLIFPIGLTYVKKYVIIIMEENNNKPVGSDSSDRLFYFVREAICARDTRTSEDSRSALQGGHFTGKLSAYEKSLEVAKIFHMGYTDRKFGPGRPTPAR